MVWWRLKAGRHTTSKHYTFHKIRILTFHPPLERHWQYFHFCKKQRIANSQIQLHFKPGITQMHTCTYPYSYLHSPTRTHTHTPTHTHTLSLSLPPSLSLSLSLSTTTSNMHQEQYKKKQSLKWQITFSYLSIDNNINVLLGNIGNLGSQAIPCVHQNGVVWHLSPVLKLSKCKISSYTKCIPRPQKVILFYLLLSNVLHFKCKGIIQLSYCSHQGL